MKLLIILSVVGVNALFFSLYSFLISTTRDRATSGRLICILCGASWVLSLPSCFLFGPVQNAIRNRSFDRHMSDMRKLRCIAASGGIPPKHDIALYGFDCEMFFDEYGEFDLHAWKKHEYDKLGL